MPDNQVLSAHRQANPVRRAFTRLRCAFDGQGGQDMVAASAVEVAVRVVAGLIDRQPTGSVAN